MRSLTLALSLSLFSCGTSGSDTSNSTDLSNPNNPDDPIASLDAPLKNGTRLHNKYINAADGTVALGTGLYDTLLKVDCSFAQAEDAMLRCLPFGAVVISSTFYLDASCTQSFAYSARCSPPFKYAVDATATTCGALNRVFNSTELPTPPANLYFKSGAACMSTSNSYAAYRMYSLGSAVPAAQFVAGTQMN